jgi:hypothetical protein
MLTMCTGYIHKQQAMSVLNNDTVLYEVGNDFVINSWNDTILHSRVVAQADGNLPLTLANEGRSFRKSGGWTGSSLSISVFPC